MDYCQPLDLQRGAAKGAVILLFFVEYTKREKANGAKVIAFAQHTKPPVLNTYEGGGAIGGICATSPAWHGPSAPGLHARRVDGSGINWALTVSINVMLRKGYGWHRFSCVSRCDQKAWLPC